MSKNEMMIPNVRVKVNKIYHDIYKDLTQSSNIRKPVIDGHGKVFILCASLGYEYDKRVPFNKGEGKPLFWSHSMTNHDPIILYSIALFSKGKVNYDILSQPEEVIKIVEEYANGGMEILMDEVLEPYVKKNNDMYYLDYSKSSFLEKDILSFINEYKNKSP
ncbi:MAG: hypothetical protein ACOCRO_11475, partial [Halanaerobiales bacterium]